MAKEKTKKISSKSVWKIAKAAGIGTLFAFVSSMFLAQELVSLSLVLGLLIAYLEIRK